MLTLLLIVLIFMFLLGLPTWGFGWQTYGWGPSGGIGVILAVILILFFMGRL
jgi:hypothetical protein